MKYKNEQIIIRLKKEEKEWLKKEAENNNMTMSEFVRKKILK